MHTRGGEVMAKGKYEYWLTEDGLTLLEGWARDGLTDEQIAKNMGIRRSTLADWKKKYSDISDTLKKGKEVVDYEVENALLAKALSGDTTAIIFWLKNRRSQTWRDKQNVEMSGSLEILSSEDKRKVMQERLAELRAKASDDS